MRFKVTIDDRPGGIMQLTSVVADGGARCQRRVCVCVCVCIDGIIPARLAYVQCERHLPREGVGEKGHIFS